MLVAYEPAPTGTATCAGVKAPENKEMDKISENHDRQTRFGSFEPIDDMLYFNVI